MATQSSFRFSLRAIFVAVAIAALIIGGALAERRYANALAKCQGVQMGYDAGVVTTMDLCAESFILYLADSGRWFRSQHAAMVSHVERLKRVEDEFESHIINGVSGDLECDQRMLDQLHVLRKRFEQETN